MRRVAVLIDRRRNERNPDDEGFSGIDRNDMVLVGAGYVLMTVQGGVFRTGLILTFIGVGVQLLGLALGADDDEQG